MIKTSQIYIPIPKARNTHCKVEINGEDVTSKVIESSWVYPVSSGIGTFNIKLSNAKGQISGRYAIGDPVKFYADNSDASTIQFWGRIDYPKDEISSEGQFLIIEGRHRSFLLNEYFVCHTATNTLTSQILKDIIDKLPESYGFTYSNVQTDTVLMNVEWNYKPFWDCVAELINKAGYDCYIDNDLDFHYFEENSIVNENDAIVEGDNFIESKEYGTDDYYEKTRVVVMGQDSGGLPIVYTAISSTEGDEIKEWFIKDNSANTMDKVQDLAEAKLAEITNKNPQARITSFGLETVKPGDNIWIIIPRQKMAGQYKLVQITHKFGMKSGGWRTEVITEEQEAGTSKIIQSLSQKSQQITDSPNVNKLNYSYNFDFDSDSGDHTNTVINGGVLKTDGSTSGTWISPTKTVSTNITSLELRAVGEYFAGATYYLSLDGGVVWTNVSAPKTVVKMTTGKNLKIKVVLNSASTQIDSLAILYS
jgi:hypothetical protein